MVKRDAVKVTKRYDINKRKYQEVSERKYLRQLLNEARGTTFAKRGWQKSVC